MENKSTDNEKQKKIKEIEQKEKKKMRLIIFLVAVLYVFSPLDIIPDILPFIGFIDDAIALLVALYLAFSPLIEKIFPQQEK